jgi:hypothetical protein
MIFTWKLGDIFSENDVITQVGYTVIAKDGENTVTTEGNWLFKDKSHFLQKETTEKDVIAWIKAESIIDEKCIIEDNLEKQLLAIKPVALQKPWILPTFKIKI